MSVSGIAVQVLFSVPCRPCGTSGSVGKRILSKLLLLYTEPDVHRMIV